MIFWLDTNAVSDWLSPTPGLIAERMSDIDLLIAAMASRLDAVIASRDTDFDILPIKRENWLDSPIVSHMKVRVKKGIEEIGNISGSRFLSPN